MTHTPRTRIVNIEERLQKRMRGGLAVRYVTLGEFGEFERLSPSEQAEITALVDKVNTRVSEMVVEHGSWILHRDSPRNDAFAVLSVEELERAETLFARYYGVDDDGPQAA